MGSEAAATVSASFFTGLARAAWQLVRHRWGEPGARRALPSETLERLAAKVAASEQLHTGQICIVAETALPWSYLRRHASARERAIMLFSKCRVWDTEHNNGVLIYLLMPERAIEIVADRGLARQIGPAEWGDVIAQMSLQFRRSRYEEGLVQAIDAVSMRLAAHFPRPAGTSSANELPDTPVVR